MKKAELKLCTLFNGNSTKERDVIDVKYKVVNGGVFDTVLGLIFLGIGNVACEDVACAEAIDGNITVVAWKGFEVLPAGGLGIEAAVHTEQTGLAVRSDVLMSVEREGVVGLVDRVSNPRQGKHGWRRRRVVQS